VIALGGNALQQKGVKSFEGMLKNTRGALIRLFSLIRDNNVVLTHGNGPSVGFLLLQQEAFKGRGMVMPLDVLDAETEGQIGYMIQQQLQNLFRKQGLKRSIVTLLTQVLVDRRDKAFREPTKFIGPFYSESEARVLRRKFDVRKDSDRGWRRVVPSPHPISIVEASVIKKLMRSGCVVIAAGGGGIPVVKRGTNLEGVEAVVDKDLASACLAESLKADIFVMITDVDRVYLNYGADDEKGLSSVKLAELKKNFSDGHFPAGSMGPKISAAISFLEKGGKKVFITDIKSIDSALRGNAGTVFVK